MQARAVRRLGDRRAQRSDNAEPVRLVTTALTSASRR
jgi:hypothetical protein